MQMQMRRRRRSQAQLARRNPRRRRRQTTTKLKKAASTATEGEDEEKGIDEDGGEDAIFVEMSANVRFFQLQLRDSSGVSFQVDFPKYAGRQCGRRPLAYRARVRVPLAVLSRLQLGG